MKGGSPLGLVVADLFRFIAGPFAGFGRAGYDLLNIFSLMLLIAAMLCVSPLLHPSSLSRFIYRLSSRKVVSDSRWNACANILLFI